MNPWPVEAEVPEVHLPRPGHADLVGVQKYGLTDVRNVLERASARETAARVAGGALAKAFLRALGVEVRSPRRADRLGARARARRHARRRGLRRRRRRRPCAAWTPTRARAMVARDQRAAQGERVARRRLRGAGVRAGARARLARLAGRSASTAASAGAICSIQAIKGVSIGDGFDVAGLPGSQAHDEIFYAEERGYYRETNRAGRPGGRHDDGRAAGRPRRDEAAADADQAAALGRHRDEGAGRRRCASAPTPAPCPPPASWARRWSRSCWPTPTGGSSAATTSTTCVAAVRAYEERIGWRPVARRPRGSS